MRIGILTARHQSENHERDSQWQEKLSYNTHSRSFYWGYY